MTGLYFLIDGFVVRYKGLNRQRRVYFQPIVHEHISLSCLLDRLIHQIDDFSSNHRQHVDNLRIGLSPLFRGVMRCSTVNSAEKLSIPAVPPLMAIAPYFITLLQWASL